MKRIVREVPKNFEQDLLQFYENVSDYDNFTESTDHPELYNWINLQEFKEVLEVGAGISLAYQKLPFCNYHAQDVVSRNRTYFEERNIFFETNALSFNKKFDLIFSTYVFEHVSNPQYFLEFYINLLNHSGRLVILCPRYDLPLYIPPSLRHLSRAKQLRIMLSFWLDSFLGISKNYFPINVDPACFSQKWKRDFDAIHLVSYFRLKRHLNKTNLKYRKIDLGYTFFRRKMTLAIEIYK